MKTTQTISTNKIVLLLILLCVCVMAALFIYRSQQNTHVKQISADYGTIFPAANDIKPFNLITANNMPFGLNNFYNHWTLLFFGFTHCAKICPTTLDMMSKAYPTLTQQFPNLQVVLISLDPERDTGDSVSKYAKAFNQNFIGVTGKMDELRKLQSQLHIYAARETTTSSNYQIQHTASILLINPEGRWAGLYHFGLNPTEFINAFQDSVKALS